MDRSLLSKSEVIAASREFVCVRLATYENKEEANFLKKLFTRNGTMENTTYAVLSPDGKDALVRPNRGPFYRSARDMASALKRISDRYTPKASSNAVPYMENFDVALNVASCDNLPLVVVSGKTQSEIDAMSKKLNEPIWSNSLAGQFVYAAVTDPNQLKAITGAKRKDGILIVEPGAFGLTASALKRLPADADVQQITAALTSVAQINRGSKDYRSHVSTGINLGIDWETKIPVTDKQSLRAKERQRGSK